MTDLLQSLAGAVLTYLGIGILVVCGCCTLALVGVTSSAPRFNAAALLTASIVVVVAWAPMLFILLAFSLHTVWKLGWRKGWRTLTYRLTGSRRGLR